MKTTIGRTKAAKDCVRVAYPDPAPLKRLVHAQKSEEHETGIGSRATMFSRLLGRKMLVV